MTTQINSSDSNIDNSSQETTTNNVENILNRTRIATINNILKRMPCFEAMARSVVWAIDVKTQVERNDEEQSFFQVQLAQLQVIAAQPFSKDFLQAIRPVDDRHFLRWATACLFLINEELVDDMNQQARAWLEEVVEEAIGTLSAIKWFALQRKPEKDDGENTCEWAKQTFMNFMNFLKDDGEISEALTWLEQQIVPPLNPTFAHVWVSNQFAAYQKEHQSTMKKPIEQSRRQKKAKRPEARKASDTIPAPAPAVNKAMESHAENVMPLDDDDAGEITAVDVKRPSSKPPVIDERTLPDMAPITEPPPPAENNVSDKRVNDEEIQTGSEVSDEDVMELAGQLISQMPEVYTDMADAVTNAKRQLGVPVYTM
ncbi:MAG: hypothetical protein WC477_04360 [Patescibacteria group bacterium]